MSQKVTGFQHCSLQRNPQGLHTYDKMACMQILISIISHAAGRTWREAIRQTWLQGQAIDYRFVVGAGVEHDQDDELMVPAPDCYEGILQKVHCTCRWADEHNYDYLFNCFTDTYVNVPRLLASGFDAHPYSGHIPKECGEPHTVALIPDEKGRFAYASGGAGYWLSRAALKIITAIEPPADMQYDDLWIGTVLGSRGIAGFHDPRYGFKGTHLYSAQQITVHLSQGTGNYDPEWMHRAHAWSL